MLVSSSKRYTAAVSVESSSTIWSMMSWRISFQIKRLVEGNGNVVQDVEFAVATANFISARFISVTSSKNTLIAFNFAVGIARGKAAFDHR